MGGVSSLSSMSFQPPSLPALLQKQIQQTLFGMALDEA
jgi:hypothetical protein